MTWEVVSIKHSIAVH